MAERFVVRVALGSPVIVSSYYTLDSLLAAIVFDATKDLHQAHEQLPLLRTSGVWHASQAFIELNETPHTGSTVLTASLRAMHDVDAKDVSPDRRGIIPRVGLSREREWGNIQNAYETIDAAALWWFGEGDSEAVERLMDGVWALGKKRTSGFGRVTGIDFDVAKVDGVMDSSSLPMRPVPLSQWVGSADALKADCAWRPAYWDPLNRAVCVVPFEQRLARTVIEGWL